MADEVKTILESLQSQFTFMQSQFTSMREEMNQRFEEMNQRFEGVDQRFEGMDQRFETVDQRFDKLERENAAAHAETRHFTQLLFENAVQPKLELLSEGIESLDQRLVRETADIRSEMRRGFEDTRSLIKFVRTVDGRL